ncbi:hypothetical protein ACFSTC_48610 [Nonomuraea ferruginea]
MLKWLVGVWGGFAVFRDAQQYVAPVALLAAVGLGLLAAAVVRESPAGASGSAAPGGQSATAGGRPGRWLVGVLVVVPVAVLPTMAWGALGGAGRRLVSAVVVRGEGHAA